MSSSLHVCALALTLALPACAGPIVNTAAPSPVAAVEARAGTTLILPPLVVPSSTTAYGIGSNSQAAAMAAQQTLEMGNLRMHEMERSIHEHLAHAGPNLVDEGDLAEVSPTPGTYVVRLEVTSYAQNTSSAPEMVVCMIVGSITVGLGYIPCMSTRNTTTHTMEVEARVYDAAGAPIARVTRNGEVRLTVDTAGRSPLLHETYTVQMLTGRHPMSGPPSGPDGERYYREEGTRLGDLVYDRLAPDLQRAIQRSAAATQAAPIAPAVPPPVEAVTPPAPATPAAPATP